jgi:hypothetical protein
MNQLKRRTYAKSWQARPNSGQAATSSILIIPAPLRFATRRPSRLIEAARRRQSGLFSGLLALNRVMRMRVRWYMRAPRLAQAFIGPAQSKMVMTRRMVVWRVSQPA